MPRACVLDAAMRRFGLELEFTAFDWAHCDYLPRTRQDDARRLVRAAKASTRSTSGAVGWPLATVPDHVRCGVRCSSSAAISTVHANVRPVRLMPGIPCPLAGKRVGDIDFTSSARTPRGGTRRSAAASSKAPDRNGDQESIFTRQGTRRPHPEVRLSSTCAAPPQRHLLTAAITKSNGTAISMLYWGRKRVARDGWRLP